MKIYAQLLLLVCLTFPGQAQNTHLDSLINQIMEQSHVTGLTACGINNGKVTWSGYYGFQNRERKKPVTQKTLFAVASTSKTVTTAAQV